jgi:hypothetical protein
LTSILQEAKIRNVNTNKRNRAGAVYPRQKGENMKVKQLLNMYLMGSNAIVKVKTSASESRLFYGEMRQNNYRQYGDLTVASFTVVDNVLTVYALEKGE